MGPDFTCTLLREKFTLADPSDSLTAPAIALSNRMILSLSQEGEPAETYIVRAQNMHSCVRLCASIAKEYSERGAIMTRVMPLRWENLWRDVTKGYEADWNPDIWCTVYVKGRAVFSDGTHHPFLDIIEKCDAVRGETYAQSVEFAESAFEQAGKRMTINHDANVALVVTMEDGEARCGVILRVGAKMTTFNFTVKKRNAHADAAPVPTVLTLCAAFLEGIQLAYHVGMTNKKVELELIDKYSDERRKGRRGNERLGNLAGAVEGIEKRFVVHYRPERPDFHKLVKEAENHAGKVLSEQAKEDAAAAVQETPPAT